MKSRQPHRRRRTVVLIRLSVDFALDHIALRCVVSLQLMLFFPLHVRLHRYICACQARHFLRDYTASSGNPGGRGGDEEEQDGGADADSDERVERRYRDVVHELTVQYRRETGEGRGTTWYYRIGVVLYDPVAVVRQGFGRGYPPTHTPMSTSTLTPTPSTRTVAPTHTTTPSLWSKPPADVTCRVVTAGVILVHGSDGCMYA